MATRGRRRRQERRAKRRAERKPQQQHYGGSKEQSDVLRKRNQAGVDAGSARETQGLDMLDAERANAGSKYQHLDQTASAERNQAGQRIGSQLSDALQLQRAQGSQSTRYGTGSDAALGDYAAGRGAILGGAGELEQLGRDAPGRYTSAADAAFAAASERNQRNALGLAAGRGNDSIRTALATADAGNRQAQLEQQVVRAQEMNQLLGLQQGAIQGAAGIRSGVAAADQQAAQIQAARQEAARASANQMLGLRGSLTGQDASIGLGTVGQRSGIVGSDAGVGMTAAGTRAEAGAGERGQFLGAEAAQEGAQLGSAMQFEQDRLARQKGPMFRAGSVLFDPANLFNRDKTQ